MSSANNNPNLRGQLGVGPMRLGGVGASFSSGVGHIHLLASSALLCCLVRARSKHLGSPRRGSCACATHVA